MRILARLESKYRSPVVPAVLAETVVAETVRNAGDDDCSVSPASAPVAIEPVQISLF
jgi:hypothetical protein